jgi:hypothetical protein
MAPFKNYSLDTFHCIFIGLVDSDGSLGWSWNKGDRAFVPSVTVSLKMNRELLDFIASFIGGYVTKTNGNWQHKTIPGVQEICLPILFSSIDDSSSCKLVTSKR